MGDFTMAESPGKMYALATVMTLLAMAAIGLRFYARRIKQTKLMWDDYMILPAMLFTIGTAICMYVGAAKGALGRHTGIDPETGPIFTRRIQVLEQIVYAVQLTQTLTFGFTKLTVLLLYRRIFPGETFRKAIMIGYGVVFVWTVGYFFSNLFQCWPIATNWTLWGYSAKLCIDTTPMILSQSWSDVFTDLAILVMPLPCIWALQMKFKHKLGVSAIFLLGLLTVGAGIAKLVIFIRLTNAIASTSATPSLEALDISYSLTPTIYWPMIESSLGIVGACLPLLRPIFTGASTKGFMRKLHMVDIPSDTSYQDPESSRATGSTAAATYNSSRTHDSIKAYKEFKNNKSGMTYINEDDSRGLDPHGLLDEKDVVTESIHCTTEVKVSSERARRADAYDMV